MSRKASEKTAKLMDAAKPNIDVWDVRTLDPDLLMRLQANIDLIRSYFEMERQIFLSHDLGNGPGRSILRPDNPHANAFYKLLEMIGLQMETRTIRAFHYTRLTDDEVISLLRNGIHGSTPETLRQRLEVVVASGYLDRDVADRLYAASPFHSEQRRFRSGKFWLTSYPATVDDRGVIPLMERWGGEVASMWVSDPALLEPLLKLGRARVIEVAAPLRVTNHSYDASRAVVATFARWRGAIPSTFAFDLYVETALPRDRCGGGSHGTVMLPSGRWGILILKDSPMLTRAVGRSLSERTINIGRAGDACCLLISSSSYCYNVQIFPVGPVRLAVIISGAHFLRRL